MFLQLAAETSSDVRGGGGLQEPATGSEEARMGFRSPDAREAVRLREPPVMRCQSLRGVRRDVDGCRRRVDDDAGKKWPADAGLIWPLLGTERCAFCEHSSVTLGTP